MCGICGIWGKGDAERVSAMVTAMHHRGPDDHGVYCDERMALGMARLSIIDVSPAGHQPMSSPNEAIWIVYNGEVYNFTEERQHLEALGHTFKSFTDTEVVLRMYEHYGDEFLLRLRGMFALAIYDRRRGAGKERLLLARDPVGIKPLLYSSLGQRLIFASELKALLASGLIKPEIDPISLRLLLTHGSVYQPHTMVRGVSMLLPGHRLVREAGGTERIDRYWNLEIDRYKYLRSQPYTIQVEEIAASLKDAVRMHMYSDVPLGAFLSGGVDSSVLVAMMAQEAGKRVKTFSVGFEAEGSAIDESDEARQTATFLGTEHTHVLVRGKDVCERILHIARSLDQPSVDGVNSYFVSLAASQALTVAISGTGGDEIFAGYPWFITMAMHEQLRKHSPIKSGLQGLAGKIAQQGAFDRFLSRGKVGRIICNTRPWAGFASRYAENYQIFGSRWTAGLLNPELREDAQAGRAEGLDLSSLDELSQGTAVERVTGLCLRGYTGNQLLRDIDAASMAHSLEVRVPYLDTKIIDMALSLPDNAKLGSLDHISAPERCTYRDSGSKRILIDVGKSMLPRDFDLQPKRGFGMPFGKWLSGPLKEVLMDTLSEDRIIKRGWLDCDEVSRVQKGFSAGRISWPQPWLLMMLELWAREVLDSVPSVP
jgi:asparagine synthase (glutamine-hydrolysing)